MSLLLTGLGSFYAIWLPVVFLTFALITLESERAWARRRRGRGLQPGPVAYLLDGLMIIGVALAIVSIIALLVSGGMAALALIGTGFDWVGHQVSAYPMLAGLIVVCIAVLAGIALVLRRGTSRGSAAHVVAAWAIDSPANLPAVGNGGTGSLGASPTGAAVSAPSLASVPATAGTSERRSVYVPMPQESLAEEPLPSLTMLQTRQKAVAAPIPKSFLELAGPKAEPSATAGGRSALVPALLMLAIVVILLGAAVLFRQQILTALSGRSAAPLVNQPGGQTTGANVGVAAVPSSSQASGQPQAQPTPAATAAATGGDAPAETRRVKSDTLNVRAGPGIDQEVVIVLAKGDTVTLLKEARVIRDTTWLRVRVGDREGWVSQAFLE